MGQTISSLARKFCGRKQLRILMCGLGQTGKTAILYKLKRGGTDVTRPKSTVGFFVETIESKDTTFTIWELSATKSVRGLWKGFFHGTQGVIFVIDSTDHDRIEEVIDELDRLLDAEELSSACFLFYANKQDVAGAMTVEEIEDELRLNELVHCWHVEPVSALRDTGGLKKGLDWLSSVATDLKIQTDDRRLEDDFDFSTTQLASINSSKKTVRPILVARAQPTTSLLLEQLQPKILESSDRQTISTEDLIELSLINEFGDDELITAFEKCSSKLDQMWNHLCFIRIVWLIFGLHGRQIGVAKILSGAQTFFAARKSGEGVFHMTVLYFWIQLIDYCRKLDSNQVGPNDTFLNFLKRHIFLQDDSLFLQYYSTDTIYSQQSMKEFSLPDIKPLPSVVDFNKREL